MKELSVLVLEDHLLQRAVMVSLLQRCGVRNIIEAGDGAEAIMLLEACGGVDIAICDLRMPGMDGLTFLSKVSQTKFIHAIIINSELDSTLRSTVGEMVKKSGLYFLGDLAKPVMQNSLKELLLRFYDLCSDHSTTNNHLSDNNQPTTEDVLSALQNNEFEAYYQPKVNLPSGQFNSAEVLARWRHPIKGILGSRSFMHILEGMEEIDTLFWQMLDQGLRLQAMNPGLALSFNVHSSQFSIPNFDEKIQKKLEAYGVTATLVTLEITETGALLATPATLKVLVRLRLMGCGLSMDDFGAGYSSLDRLCKLPFSQIKLDAAFVKGLHRESRGYAVIESAITLASSMAISLVIEGVESVQQQAYLEELGCREAQGYLFGRPVPAPELMRNIYSGNRCGSNINLMEMPCVK